MRNMSRNTNNLHLCVIVDIDHIDRSVSVTDVEYAVIIRLQHLQKINICPTIDEDKILKLHKKKRRVRVGGAKTYHHWQGSKDKHNGLFPLHFLAHLTCSLSSRKAVPSSCHPVTGTSVYWTWSQWNNAWGPKEGNQMSFTLNTYCQNMDT